MWGKWHSDTTITRRWIWTTSAHRHKNLAGQAEPSGAGRGAGRNTKSPAKSCEIGDSRSQAEGAESTNWAEKRRGEAEGAEVRGKGRRLARRAEAGRKDPRSGFGSPAWLKNREVAESPANAMLGGPWVAETGQAGGTAAGCGDEDRREWGRLRSSGSGAAGSIHQQAVVSSSSPAALLPAPQALPLPTGVTCLWQPCVLCPWGGWVSPHHGDPSAFWDKLWPGALCCSACTWTSGSCATEYKATIRN